MAQMTVTNLVVFTQWPNINDKNTHSGLHSVEHKPSNEQLPAPSIQTQDADVQFHTVMKMHRLNNKWRSEEHD